MATRQTRFEDKFGLGEAGETEAKFDKRALAIAWDVVNGKYDIYNHPQLQQEDGIDWLFFIVVKDKQSALWAIRDSELSRVQDIVANGDVWPCDLESSMEENCLIRRYHVVYSQDSDSYFVRSDKLTLTSPKYDVCLYVGTLTISERALDVLMASLADKTYLLLVSDCLEYCKTFVYKYFEMTSNTMDKEQKELLEKLTVMTIFMSQLSEKSGRKYYLSGTVIRSFLTSSPGQIVLASALSSLVMVFLMRRFME